MAGCGGSLPWSLGKTVPATAWSGREWAECHYGQMSQHLAAHIAKRSDEEGFYVVKPDLNDHAIRSPALGHCHSQPAPCDSAAKAPPMMSAGLCGGDAAPRHRSSWPAPCFEALQRGRSASRRISGEEKGVLERRRLAARVVKSAAVMHVAPAEPTCLGMTLT
jgi:hypothetical protein